MHAGAVAVTSLPASPTSTPPAAERRAAAPPLYQQLVAALREEILKGVYVVGDKLPSEDELAARFQVSRHTVREALRHLRTDGLVSSRRGAGTTIERPGAAQPYVHEVASLSDLIQYAASTRYSVDSSAMVQADAALAALVGGEVGQTWFRLEGFRYAEGAQPPVCWTQVFLHPDYAGVSRLVGRRGGAVYELMEDLYGVRVGEVTQVIKSRPLPRHVAEGLQAPPDATAIEVTRTYRLTSGKVAEVAVNYYPAERFTFAMTLRRAR